MNYTSIDLKELCADGVSVCSWCHSGPVSVDLKGIWLEVLIRKLNETGKVKAEIVKEDSDGK
jgi:hypothetical protein